ncbi:MAG TPA: amino acid ABC transporter substrate-binding protein [bacterium]|nr:amino acid ABC transporter substrate-binding protein [bacterium]
MRTPLGNIALAAILVVLVTVGLQGLASPQSTGNSRVIKLGAAISNTGNLAAEGKLTTDGYDFAVEWINAHGGVKVVGQTYTFAPIKYYDDESKPAQSAALMEKLVTEDHIGLILGPYSSDNTIAAAAVSTKYGAVLMADEGVAKSIWTSGNKNVVGPVVYDYQYMYPVVDALIAGKTGIKSAVMMHADDSFSVGVAEGAVAYLKEKGINVLGDFQYPAATTDVSSVLAQIKELHADALLSSGHVQDAILITRQAKQNAIGFKAMAFTVAPPTPDYVKALGKDAEDVIGPAPWVPQENFSDPYWGSTQKFVSAFKAKYGFVPDYHVGNAVIGVELFAQAIAKADSLDPTKVGAAFLNVTYQSIGGPVHFNNNWHEDNQHGAAIQLQGGVPVPVWPAQYIKRLRYPMPSWARR